MRPPEGVARVRQININPLSSALRGSKNGVGIEKGKAERLDTDKTESAKIQGVRAGTPEQRQDPEEA